ncbi:hypothetical protein ABVT39_011462 [Epinephelus coioides]
MNSAVIAFLASLLVLCAQGQRDLSSQCKCYSFIGKSSTKLIKGEPVIHSPSNSCPHTEIIITTTADMKKCVNPKSPLGQLILKNKENSSVAVDQCIKESSLVSCTSSGVQTEERHSVSHNLSTANNYEFSCHRFSRQPACPLCTRTTGPFQSVQVLQFYWQDQFEAHQGRASHTQPNITTTADMKKCVNPKSPLGQLILKNKENSSVAVDQCIKESSLVSCTSSGVQTEERHSVSHNLSTANNYEFSCHRFSRQPACPLCTRTTGPFQSVQVLQFYWQDQFEAHQGRASHTQPNITTTADMKKCVNPKSPLGQLILKNKEKQEKNGAGSMTKMTTTTASSQTHTTRLHQTSKL